MGVRIAAAMGVRWGRHHPQRAMLDGVDDTGDIRIVHHLH